MSRRVSSRRVSSQSTKESSTPTCGEKRGKKKYVDRLTLFLERVTDENGKVIVEDINKAETKIARAMFRLLGVGQTRLDLSL